MKQSHIQQTSNQQQSQSTNKLIIITLLIGFLLSMIVLLISSNIRQKEQAFSTQIINTGENPCKYVIKINYKNKPVDIRITSPLGSTFGTHDKETNTCDYTYMLTDSQIILSINTQELGDWKLDYNHAYHNNNMTIEINKLPYAGCYIKNITTKEMNNVLDISFIPFTQTGKEQLQLKGYVLVDGNLNNPSTQTILFSDIYEIMSNQKTTISINTTTNYNNSTNKTIRLIVYESNATKTDRYYANVLFHTNQ